LIAFGALSIPQLQMTGVLDGRPQQRLVPCHWRVGAGAAMLSTGAAGARARILCSLPDEDDEPTSAVPSTAIDKTPVLSGTEAGNGQAEKSTKRGH
jgi:hypothetical protein